jgi:plastocyanin
MSPARAATTYEIIVGADYFESAGIPGFSTRFYPGSVKLHKGDILHFAGFGAPALLPKDLSTAEAIERFAFDPTDPYSNPVPDPDDGPDAWKFDFSKFTPTFVGCGTADNPCEWAGSDPDAVGIPEEVPEIYVTITANPGDVIYANLFGYSHDADFRIEVVAQNETASTQAELDTRASQLQRDDLDKAGALLNRFSTRESSHVTRDGTRVTDVWVGVENGPVALLGMFPRKVTIKRGQTVQFHFDYEGMETHDAFFPKSVARDVLFNTFVPVCDTDGDTGTALDVEPIFDETDPEAPPACPDGAVLEFDLDPRQVTKQGNGVFAGASDVENSGIRTGELLQPHPILDESPWNLKFKKISPDGGWKYMCTIHGGLMSGLVIVK